MKRVTFLAGLFLISLLFISNLIGQGVPSPLTIRMQPYLSGLSLPVHITSAKDGTKRLFVIQQRGIIKVVQPGAFTTTDFINLSSVVSQSGNERGLLGLAFHPQFTTNRKFYVYYTRNSDGGLEIAEYLTMTGNPNQGDPSTARIILTIPHPTNSNHNGGTILFGPDGYLYLGTGDGGSGNDPPGNAQNINALLGKMIRIDINAPVGQVPAYNIPPTNPYAGATPGADEIYAIGMRNPYRFSFDRGGTNQLWVGDVGQDAIEEVDIITLGGNYGWRVYEGTQCTNIEPTNCIPTNYLPPVFQYSSSGAGNPRCSVTGGYVYRGTQNTLPVGSYIYADYCSGEILLWNNAQQNLLLDTARNISSFGEDEAGELYVVGLGGTVEKVVRARASADFDGDFRTDISVFRPSTGVWYASHTSNGTVRIQQFGLNNDVPTPEDYDGDNISDIAVFRPSDGSWYYFRSGNSTVGIVQFGSSGDIPTAGDYDGDAKTDFSVYRPSTNVWYVLRTLDFGVTVAPFGLSGDIPAEGDFDGDGRVDIAIFRPSSGDWWYSSSADNGLKFAHFGASGDIPTVGDYDADGRMDFAVFRPSNNVWYQMRTTSGFFAMQWGAAGDIPTVGDYDGDAREDIGVFRPSTGVWYLSRSSNGSALIQQFGLNGDLPAPAYDAP
jgi:glucose/arabinose dehydrogenase